MPDQSESSKAKPDETYEAPKIEWEEVLEEAGVYAACIKDPGGALGQQCTMQPNAGSS